MFWSITINLTEVRNLVIKETKVSMIPQKIIDQFPPILFKNAFTELSFDYSPEVLTTHPATRLLPWNRMYIFTNMTNLKEKFGNRIQSLPIIPMPNIL